MSVAKHTTNATVKVSGYVADRVGNLTKSLANHLGKMAAKPVTGVAGGAIEGTGKDIFTIILKALIEDIYLSCHVQLMYSNVQFHHSNISHK